MGREEDTPWLVVCHPFPQADEPLMTGTDWQTLLVHSNTLVAFSEVKGPGKGVHQNGWQTMVNTLKHGMHTTTHSIWKRG